MHRDHLIHLFLEDVGTLKRLSRTRIFGHRIKQVISQAQLSLLFSIAADGPKSIKELASEFHMTSSASTQLVDVLVNQKYLERTEDAHDRRKISVALTKKGRKELASLRKRHAAHFTKLLSPLSDKELQSLVRLQQKIIAHLTK